jgi:putative nucleotidyltransferase with HDIG domain
MVDARVQAPPRVLHLGSLARVGTPPEDLSTRLANEALIQSGARAVHIYLWDPAGDFLYGAGVAGDSDEELESAGFPLSNGLGFIFFRGCSPSPRGRARLRQFATKAGRVLQHRQSARQQPLSGPEQATIAFISALRAKSPITAQHCARVARSVAATALAMNFTESQVCHAERCGLLHDIGKLAITEYVLEKPTELNPEEWAFMRTHPQLGAQILQPCHSLAQIIPAVAMHHERFDGNGYPNGASGAEIPVEARMVNVCDAYDTMTNDRPYRKAMEFEEALSRLRLGAGSQFDPDLVNVFITKVFPTIQV